MRESELLRNIKAQPESLRGVIDRHSGKDGGAALTEAAAIVRSADHVIFTGMGSSLFACIPAAHLLIDSGRQASVVGAAELLYYQMPLCRPGCVVLLVSRSGETVEVLKLLNVLKQGNCRIIGVTNEPQSTLAREAELSIIVGSRSDQLVALQTYTGTVTTLVILAGVAIRGDREGAMVNELARLPDALSQAIPELLALTPESTWAQALERTPAVYLLGRGPSLASVREGALLFNESARTPSVGMSAAEFRHGPVEVVGPSFFAFVFASQPATAALDRRLAEDIVAAGGHALEVGPLGSEMPSVPWLEGRLAPILAPVLEIVFVQIAAWWLAERKGIAAGSFQFAPLITSSESGFEKPARIDG